jgi:hypothetical protein
MSEFPELSPEMREALEKMRRSIEAFRKTFPPEQIAEIAEASRLLKQLTPEQQERYGDWTVQQLLAFKDLIEEFDEPEPGSLEAGA